MLERFAADHPGIAEYVDFKMIVASRLIIVHGADPMLVLGLVGMDLYIQERTDIDDMLFMLDPAISFVKVAIRLKPRTLRLAVVQQAH